MKYLSKDAQRKELRRREPVSIGMQAKLRRLVDEILAGDSSKIPEFQQDIRYATPEMLESVKLYLEEHAKNQRHT